MPSLVLANLIAIGLLAGLTGFMLARRPSRPMWPWILLFQLCLIAFVTGDAITKTASNITFENFGVSLLYSGSFLGIGCWWMVTLRFAELQGCRLPLARPCFTRPVLVFALGGWLFAASNPWHEQFLLPVVDGRYEHYATWWLLGVGGHLLAGASIVIYAWLAMRARSRRNRSNAVIMLLVAAIPGVVNLTYAANSAWSTDPTPLAVCVSSGLFVWGTLRTGLFSLTPFALEAILRHEPASVLVADRRGEVLFANPAAERLLGVESIECRDGIFAALARRLRLPDTEGEMPIDELQQLLIGSPSGPGRLLMRDDSDRWLEVEVNSIPHRWGAGAALALYLRDVTEQRRAEAEHLEYERQMHKAQRLESIGVLAGGVAHDFNNLLTAILVNAELGLEFVGGDSRAEECLREICSVSHHAAAFVAQLVAYAGQSPKQPQPVDCAAIAREMKTLVVGVVGKTVLMELRLGSDLPAVSADCAQLRQVMMNLLINAAEAQRGRDGAVELEIGSRVVSADEVSRWVVGDTRRAGRYVFIRVSDRGGGMDEVTLARVLEPFFSTKETARGLGLAATVGILRTHDAGLSIESTVGVGSTFTVYLAALDRLASEVGGAETKGVDAAPSTVDGRGATVLVIDDEDSVRRGAHLALEGAGFAVVVAEGGRQALRRMHEHPGEISVVLLDACMPEMSGRDTLREIRRLAPEVPVVLTSGHQEGVRLFEESRGSVSAFLAKPFTKQQVVEAVGNALARSAALTDARRGSPAGQAVSP